MSNSLAAVHPELVAEWSEKNLPLTPDSITFDSNKKVWWKGTCGHEWQASVKARSNGEKCPICSGARVIAGINDLNTLKPKLASEWSEKNEIKPTEVSIGSHKKVIWKCKLGHEWTARRIYEVQRFYFWMFKCPMKRCRRSCRRTRRWIPSTNMWRRGRARCGKSCSC